MLKQEYYKVPYNVPTPNNMGVVRYVLAFCVFVTHLNILGGYNLYTPLSSYSAVGGFFALSGFLIFGSYFRSQDIKKYLLSRARRLLPAYWITVLFFAITLSLISTIGIQKYFLSHQFGDYVIYNMAFANFLQPTLPGVFEGLDNGIVNGSLWTMKVEWCLCLTVPIIIWSTNRFKIKPYVMLGAIYILSCAYRILFVYIHDATGVQIYEMLGRQFLGQLSYLCVGALCYYYLETLLNHRWVIIGLGIIMICLYPYVPYGKIILHPIAIGIIVIWISMVGKWGTWEGKHDNISYNIYLVHFPVIQLFEYLKGDYYIDAIPALLICGSATMLFALLLHIPEIKIRRHFTHKRVLKT